MMEVISVYLWVFLKKLESFLCKFDPSHFQNVIIGILTVFIPFALAFISDILDKKDKKDNPRAELEKEVLTDEILAIKHVFWITVISIGSFALIDKESDIVLKIISIVILIGSVCFLYNIFKNMLKFAKGDKSSFILSFLKKRTPKEQAKAWSSFWQGKAEYDETEFRDVFIQHIDDAIKSDKFQLDKFNLLAKDLFQPYIDHIDKRCSTFYNAYLIIIVPLLPQVLQWIEYLARDWAKGGEDNSENQLLKHQLLIYFTEQIIAFHCRNPSFQAQLFEDINKHIKESTFKSKEIVNTEEKERYSWKIKDLLNILFDEAYKLQEKNFFDLFRSFMTELKKPSENNETFNLVFDTFLDWLKDKIFKSEYKLRNIMLAFFDDHPFYESFLKLAYSDNNIKEALKKESNFYFSGVFALTFLIGDDEEEKSQRFAEERNRRKLAAINTISKTFSYPVVSSEDYTEDDRNNWETYTKEQKLESTKQARISKLNKMLEELNGIVIEDEGKKDNFRELITGLIDAKKNQT